jgi:hypothetical protein
MVKNRIYLIVFCFLEFVFLPFKALSQKANPLPFAANWENGSNNRLTGYTPEWQMKKIEEGHHILLSFGYNFRFGDWFINLYLDEYFKNPIEKASKYGIPIVIKTTQPESMLFRDPWFNYPPEDNPNVVDSNETVHKDVSPCGPIEHWGTVGKCWVNPYLLVDLGYSPADWWSDPLLSRFQDWYPDPPFVIWLSNNEAGDVDYRDAHEDYRFKETYSSDPNYETWQFRNEIIGGNTDLTNPGAGGYETGHGYIPRYNSMFDGMRSELDEWSDKIKFVGYEHDPLCFGRWSGWIAYNPSPIPDRFSTVPFIWDGTSPSYYVNDWQWKRMDYTGYSPQVEAMNLLFQRDYYRKVNPDFWWEVSTWFDPEYIDNVKSKGQEVPPERYESYIKWVMWLIRPRAVRDFKYSTETREESWIWYKTVVDAVDEVHVNPILERFWKYSEPVLLTDIPHPYSSRDEFWPELFPYNNERMRWYQIPNDITYEPGYNDDVGSITDSIYNVWIMANAMGTSPNREWLIYAYTPLEADVEVEAQLPGYESPINLTAKREGTYYLVRESGSNEYITTEPGVRAAEFNDIELEWGEQYKFNAIYSSAYKCDITDYSWDFGDGTERKGITVDHSFAQPGTYEVHLTVTSNIGKTDVSTMNVSVGKTAGRLPVHNFPNPFNPNRNKITNIRYSISQTANVTIKIYDTGNNLVKELIDNETQELKEGYYDIPWDGKNGKGEVAANGVYFVVVETSAGERGIGKICVIR